MFIADLAQDADALSQQAKVGIFASLISAVLGALACAADRACGTLTAFVPPARRARRPAADPDLDFDSYSGEFACG
jgi:hypothetical protein